MSMPTWNKVGGKYSIHYGIFIFLACFIIILPYLVFAQSSAPGAIRGRIFDQKSQPLAGIQVQVTKEPTDSTQVQLIPYCGFSPYTFTYPSLYSFFPSFILPPWIPEEFRQGLSKIYFISCSDFPIVYTTQSQADGRFLLNNLPEGRYILWAYDFFNRGYIANFYGFQEDRSSDNQNNRLYSGDFGGRPNYIPIRVKSGKISGPINHIMEMGGILSGRITDAEDGSAVISAKIITRSRKENNLYLFKYSAAAITDLNGNFILSGLKEGEYILGIVEAEGYIINSFFPQANSSENSEEDFFQAAAGQTTSNCNLSLIHGGEIFGSITNQATGQHPVEAFVTASKFCCEDQYFPEGYASPYSTVTAEIDGTYRLTGLEEGIYTISAFHSGPGFQGTNFPDMENPAPNLKFPVEQGERVGPIDVSLFSSTAQGVIRGQIIEAGTGLPISGISLHLGDLPSTAHMASYINLLSNTDHEGIFEFTGLENYTYFLTISDPTKNHLTPLTPADSIFNQFEWAVNPDVVQPAKNIQVIQVSMYRGGCLEGQILDGSTPLAGMEVQTIAFDADLLGDEVYSCSWPSSAFDKLLHSLDISDTEGRFTVCGLDTRNYLIRVRDLFHRGYMLSFSEDPNKGNMPRSFSVPLNTKITGLIIPMEIGSTLTGRVVDKAQNPLANIQVEGVPQKLAFLDPNGMAEKDFRAYSNLWSVPVRTFTQEDGTYTFPGLSQGAYMITARDPNSHYLSNCLIGISVSSSGEEIVSDLILSSGSILSGRITNAHGQPLSEIRVIADRDNSADDESDPALSCPCLDEAGYFTVKTSKEGDYRIKTLPAGNYQLYVEDKGREYLSIEYDGPNFISVGLNGEEEEISDLDFCLKRGGIIRGVIRNAITGQALSGVKVRARLEEDRSPVNYYSAISDDQGNYTRIGLPEGSYSLSVSHRENYRIQYYPGVNSLQEAIPLDIAPEQTLENIDFNLIQGVGLVCTVRDAITGKEMLAKEYSLKLIDEQGVEIEADFYESYYPPFDPYSKEFTLCGLSPATYFIRVTDCRGYYAGYYHQQGDDPESGTPLLLSQPGTIEKIEVSIYPKASISGRLVDAFDQRPLYKKLVAALPVQEPAPDVSCFHDRYAYYIAGGYQFDVCDAECALTDPNGRYRIINLEEGDYRLLAVGPWHMYEDQYYHDLPTDQWQQADIIHVKRSESITGINIGLHLGVSYSGVISYSYRNSLQEVGELKIISEPEKEAMAGRLYEYPIQIENPGTQSYLTYVLRQGPQNMNIDSKLSLLQWQPTNEDGGRAIVQVAVHDSLGRLALQSYGLQVEEDHTPPEEVSSVRTNPGVGKVTLSWTSCHDGEGDLADLVLYIDNGRGDYREVSFGKNTTEYTLRGLSGNRSYTFRISTRDLLGNESKGVLVKATPKSRQINSGNWFQPWSFWGNQPYGFSYVNPFLFFTGNHYPFTQGTSLPQIPPSGNWFQPWSFWENQPYGFSYVNPFLFFTSNHYPFTQGTSLPQISPLWDPLSWSDRYNPFSKWWNDTFLYPDWFLSDF